MSARTLTIRLQRMLLASALLLLPMIGLPAQAAGFGAPGWAITAQTYPTNLSPEGRGTIEVDVYNIGAGDSSGPITVTDTLPAGFTAREAGGLIAFPHEGATEPPLDHELWQCKGNGGLPGEELVAGATEVTCTNNLVHFPTVSGGGGPPALALSDERPNLDPRIGIIVDAPGIEGVGLNHATVSGGSGANAATANSFTVGSVQPPFGFAGWDGWFSNANGTIDTQAGSHPYEWSTWFNLAEALDEKKLHPADGDVRNLIVKLPPGLVGNPQAVPRCSRRQFDASASAEEPCPRASQVGDLFVRFELGTFFGFPVYNLVPPPGAPAEFGVSINSINTFLDPTLRSGADYGITTDIDNTPQKGVISSLLTLWGVPGDPSHDRWRHVTITSTAGCTEQEVNSEENGCFSIGEHPTLKTFLTLPTFCGEALPFSIEANTWQDEALSEPLSFLSHDAQGEPAGFTGCNRLPFEPTITSQPTTNATDSPTGLEFDLHIPQTEEATAVEEGGKTIGAEPGLAQAHLKKAVVKLPKGLVVNPASANGLAACTESQVGYIGPNPELNTGEYTPAPANCPDAAKIGTVEVDTPLLDHPLPGAVYVAKPSENPFNSLLALYITVDDPQTGVVVKLAGEVHADPVTGQLVTTVESPQQPFEDFHLDFFKGANAALRTPSTCATYESTTEMTPWSTPEGADAFPADSFALTQSPTGGPCPTSETQLPNKPNFEAGTLQPKAGAYSPFLLHLARADGSQEITAIDTTLPEGLIGKLAGVSECSDAQIAQAASRNRLGEGALEQSHPSCPANSLVGKVSVGAGAGPSPYYVSGNAYLAGPYKGAPLSLEIITPAVAGPYDLGAVAVRTALYVNTETAQIHAVSDPIPHILAGIPLDVRSINLELNRDQFTLNPTSCAKKQITGAAISALGQLSPLTSPFQVGDCQKLGFEPKLAIHLHGSTRRGGTPALKATLTYPSKGAYANIAKASVALPHSEFLDNAHIKTICTRVQFAEGATPGERCPPGSVYGFAKASTPLLDKPLEGPVYLRSSSNKLPDLVAALNGQISVVLDGTIDSIHGGIRNRFEVVPDASVSKFTLSMQGGKKGLLENSTNLCASTNRATARFTAQNGLIDEYRPAVTNDCKGKAKHRKKAHKKKHHGAG